MNPLNTVRELFAKVPLFGRLSDFEVTRGTVLAGVGYLLFGLVVFCLVFAARYYVVQTDALVREVVGKLDGVTVEFPHLEPQLVPPRVTVEYVRVYHKKTRKPILLLKDTDLRLSFLPLLMGKLSLSATSRAYGGLGGHRFVHWGVFQYGLAERGCPDRNDRSGDYPSNQVF